MEITYINEELSRVWPDWTVDRLIGRGSFGTVYEIHRGSGIYEEKAALKILRVTKDMTGADRLRPGGTNGEDPQKYFDQYIDSFRKEIVLMQRLMGNSHIVSYEDYSIRRYKNAPGGNIYIRMELLTSLTEYLETHEADDRLILKIGMDIAEGLRQSGDSERVKIRLKEISEDIAIVDEAIARSDKEHPVTIERVIK